MKRVKEAALRASSSRHFSRELSDGNFWNDRSDLFLTFLEAYWKPTPFACHWNYNFFHGRYLLHHDLHDNKKSHFCLQNLFRFNLYFRSFPRDTKVHFNELIQTNLPAGHIFPSPNEDRGHHTLLIQLPGISLCLWRGPVLRKAPKVFAELLTRMTEATKLICSTLQGQPQVRKEHRSSENLLQNNSYWNCRPLVTAPAQNKANLRKTPSKNRDPSTSEHTFQV